MENLCSKKLSNLQSFLSRTTPLVPTQPLPKTCLRDLNSLWQPIGKDKVEYFTLGDLWEEYREWSVYGADIPVILGNSESLVQYYVPYLSAIQIYTSKCYASPRIVLEESETESFSDDSESERLSKSWDTVSDDSVREQDGSWASRELLGQLYFQYIDNGSPYGRIPLFDKVNELAQKNPGLLSFKSIEISPASWMSVAWYPIYHIPPRTNIRDLSTCFLTYHTISASFQDDIVVPMKALDDTYPASANKRSRKRGGNYISLYPFGLASYRMQGNIWRIPGTSDAETLSTLHSAAHSWLTQLGVEHHDFNFFASR